MKIDKKFEAILVVFLSLFCLYLWTLPFQENRMPYGEVDAGSHFTLGDYMAQTDKPIYTLPYFIDMRYGNDNFFSPHHLWYHPPYHVNFAIMQIIGGERILPIFLFNAILCSIIVLVIYFFMRELFGFWPAFLTSFIMIFSMRDIMIYLWGQWPQQISYFYTPLVLYAFYKYADSYLDGNPKPVYAYVFAVLLGINFYLHPVGSFHTILAIGFFSFLLFVKEKKIPFGFKHISFCILIFITMLAIFPLQTASVFEQTKGGSKEEKISSPAYHDFSGFLYWFPWKEIYSKDYKTQPEQYFNYNDMNGGYWTIPLLLAGLILVLFRRKRKDFLLLSYLLAIYFMIHLAIFGSGRPERSLAASAHIFYPLIVLGLLAIPSFLNLFINVKYKEYIKYFLIASFIFMVLSFNFMPAYNQLKSAYRDPYGDISRITPNQYNAAELIKESSIPLDANITVLGTLGPQKARWLRYVSWRYMYEYKGSLNASPKATYIMIDYSDLIILQNSQQYRDQLNQIKEFEKNDLNNKKKVFEKDNIKVYELGD